MNSLEAGRVALEDAVHAYLTAEPHERTGPMKAAGRAVFRAREDFELANGTKDVLGRSPAYRAWLSSVLDNTNLPRSRQPAFLSALRHHVSAEIRLRLSPEELHARGISPDDAATRTRRRRRRNDLEDGVRSTRRSAPVTDPREIVEAVDTITHALSRIHYGTRHPDVEVAIRRLGDALSQLSPPEPDPEVIYF